MEESGRNEPRHPHCRLLTRLAGVFCICIFAALPAAGLEVDIFVSSFEVSAGEPVSVSFTVHGSEPASTSLAEPDVPESFVPSSSRKELVQLESSGVFSGTRTAATVISREWIPSESGSFSLGPFTLSSLSDSVTLPPVYITVVAPHLSEFSALRWVVSGGEIRTGIPHRIVLEGFFSGKPGTVSCAAPENALLSPVTGSKKMAPAVSGTEAGWATVAEYDWTPLAEGNQNLPSAIFEYTTPAGAVRKLASPIRPVQVLFSAPVAGRPPVSKTLGRAFSRPAPADHPAPGDVVPASFSPALLPADLAARFSAMPWKEGNYAVILQALRRAEYTHLFPARYRKARLAAEASLSLGETLAVPPAAWKFWCVTGFAALLCLSILLRIAFSRSLLLRGLSFMGIAASVLLAIFAVYVYTRDLVPAGVVAGGDLLTVPEISSTVIENLAEGRTVRIRRKAGPWLFVTADSSLGGWIPADRVLQYTIMESDQ